MFKVNAVIFERTHITFYFLVKANLRQANLKEKYHYPKFDRIIYSWGSLNS